MVLYYFLPLNNLLSIEDFQKANQLLVKVLDCLHTLHNLLKKFFNLLILIL